MSDIVVDVFFFVVIGFMFGMCIYECRKAMKYSAERIKREKRIEKQLEILENCVDTHCDPVLCAHRLVEFNKDVREGMKKHIEAIEEGREYDF